MLNVLLLNYLLIFFTNRCLIKDFEKRPSVTHLLDHPFIKGTQGKVLFLQKQLANVLRDQKRLNPVAKTRYGSVHRSGVLLWVFGRRAWLCFGLLYIFIGNNHIFVFSQSFICVLSSRSCGWKGRIQKLRIWILVTNFPNSWDLIVLVFS